MRRFGVGLWMVGLAGWGIACESGTSQGRGSTDASDGGGTGGVISSTTGGGGLTAGQSGGGGASATSGGAGGTGSSAVAGAASTGGLPAAHTGIASRYPGDVGIGTDPSVVFADDFESYPANATGPEINQVWDAVYQNQYVGIATDAPNVHGGRQALQFTLPQGDAELSDATDKVLSQELDTLYLRYYSKFQPPYDVVGSSHNGSSISAHYFQGNNATPGVRADGTNKFLVNLENWRGDTATASPGQLNVYVYHPEQRSDYGDHFYPTGLVNPNTSIPFDFGPNFVPRPDIIPELDRWYCYEYMVQANTPGQRDGRISIWLDGELVADFENLRFRDADGLKIDRFGLSFHIKSNPNGEANKWYDDVVAATSYIGPVVP